MHAGDQLRAANWRQGDLVESFPGHVWIDTDEDDKPVARIKVPGVSVPGLLISQTCDIVADEDKEPFVQIARVSKSPAENVAQWRRGHQRRFVVDDAQGYVADIRYCTSVPKNILLQMRRIGQLPPERLKELQHWLASRYARPAVTEELYARIFGPGRAFFSALAARDDEAATVARTLSSVRIGLVDSDDLEYSLYFVSPRPVDDETMLILGELAMELEIAIGERAKMAGWYSVTRGMVVVEEWEKLLPLESTPLTYGGETITGPEPSEFML